MRRYKRNWKINSWKSVTGKNVKKQVHIHYKEKPQTEIHIEILQQSLEKQLERRKAIWKTLIVMLSTR